jgi:antitoxin component of MazEF toxin-antitoxin module
VISVGDQLGIIPPPEALKHLNVGPGDTLYLTVQSNSIYLSVIEPKNSMRDKPCHARESGRLEKLADS